MNLTLPAMPSQSPSHPTLDIAEKVLRRAEIAKVARNLQDRLALANFKAQNGWQNRTLKTIEPEVTEQLRRKRPYSSGDVLSDSSSNTSEEYFHNYSPLTGPAFSDDVPGSRYKRRSHGREQPLISLHNFGSRKKSRSSSNVASTKLSIGSTSWKQSHRLSHSSPVFQRPQLPFTTTTLRQSFVSDAATMPDSRHPRSSLLTSQSSRTHDDDDDLPVHSFTHHSHSPGMIASSPPRTPSPTRRIRKPRSKESGADLLLYLANSPSRSPALNHRQPQHYPGMVQPPSTPPAQHTTTTTSSTNTITTPAPALPSSFLCTPTSNSTTNLPLFSTPGQQFNFADFVNVTPSPAQAPWGGRTPGSLNKTPVAARAARRGLNFDNLVPPTITSPTMHRAGQFGGGTGRRASKGLALELGDKLMPRS